MTLGSADLEFWFSGHSKSSVKVIALPGLVGLLMLVVYQQPEKGVVKLAGI